MSGNNPHGAAVAWACLPEVLLVRDVALALGLTASGARQAIHRGECGPHFRIGRKLAILRESFIHALSKKAMSFRVLPPTLGGSR